MTRTSIFLGKLFASKNVLTPSEQLKKASHIKQSVLNSVQNHGEKLLQVGPNSKKLVKIKRLSVTYYNTHTMLAFSSYRNQLFGLQGKCSGCMIRILVLIGLNQQTISHCNVCLFLTSDNSISPANKMSGETLTVECQQSILKLR